jgi:hypothetical protein
MRCARNVDEAAVKDRTALAIDVIEQYAQG